MVAGPGFNFNTATQPNQNYFGLKIAGDVSLEKPPSVISEAAALALTAHRETQDGRFSTVRVIVGKDGSGKRVVRQVLVNENITARLSSNNRTPIEKKLARKAAKTLNTASKKAQRKDGMRRKATKLVCIAGVTATAAAPAFSQVTLDLRQYSVNNQVLGRFNAGINSNGRLFLGRFFVQAFDNNTTITSNNFVCFNFQRDSAFGINDLVANQSGFNLFLFPKDEILANNFSNPTKLNILESTFTEAGGASSGYYTAAYKTNLFTTNNNMVIAAGFTTTLQGDVRVLPRAAAIDASPANHDLLQVSVNSSGIPTISTVGAGGYGFYVGAQPSFAVPEPGTLALLGMGGALLIAIKKFRSKIIQ